MRKFISLLCLLLIVVGFEQPKPTIPTKIEKINLKLLDEELAITFFNLSEGEATLIQNNNGEAVLVNTGNQFSQNELIKFLKLYGVSTINKIIITKMAPDYAGNVDFLCKLFGVKNIIVPHTETNQNISYPARLNYWEEGRIDELFPGVTTKVLQVIDSENAMNVSMKYGKHRFLFMSVASKSLEDELIKKTELKDVNILKVAEFASNNGTSQKLLEAVDPQVAIIFNKTNLYPSADVLERLQGTWIDIYYTRQFGNITIKSNKERYEVITITVESLKEMGG
ncbi:ComEC/Rec2 family competence protein [Bacillus salitolerans]|uniref:ComEC/Rec2 family competence protein n=1 Tax=Bacillus salitolerans TaxID=1437434 RepID=A0ABW4LVA8_9BACI